MSNEDRDTVNVSLDKERSRAGRGCAVVCAVGGLLLVAALILISNAQ